MNETPDRRRRIYCNECRQVTNHWMAGHHFKSEWDDDDGINFESHYTLWICAGCETGTLEIHAGPTDALDERDFDGSLIFAPDFFPERVHSQLRKKSFMKLKPKLKSIYGETIKCFNTGSLVLCTAGLRALLEGVCDDKRIKGRNLRDKINNLHPLLPNRNIIKSLHHFRFTGNEAVHQLQAPDARDTRLAIDVLEDLLNFLYELDYKATRLRNSVKKKKTGLVIPVPPSP